MIKKSIYIRFFCLLFFVGTLVLMYNIRESNDAYRHYIKYTSIDVNKTITYYYQFFYSTYNNFIFYIGLVLFKKMNLGFKMYIFMISVLYYYLSFKIKDKVKLKFKDKIILLIPMFILVNPYYVISILHLPMAIIFFELAILCFWNKFYKLEKIFLIVSYYTHTGFIFIILSYLFSKIKFMKIFINFKFLLSAFMIFIVIKEYFLLKLFNLIFFIFPNNKYFFYKIQTYLLQKVSYESITGGFGLISLSAIIYFNAIVLLSMFFLKKNISLKVKKIIEFTQYIIIISIFLSLNHTVFLIRSTYIYSIVYPFIYSNIEKKNKKIVDTLICIGMIYIIEYRFLLNIY